MRLMLLIFCSLLIITVKAQNTVDLNDLKNHVGDTITVVGKVFTTRYLPDAKNSPTLLNIGAAYPNQLLTVVIWGDRRNQFPHQAPEEYYKGKLLKIKGRVGLFRDRPQIVVSDATAFEEITIVENKNN